METSEDKLKYFSQTSSIGGSALKFTIFLIYMLYCFISRLIKEPAYRKEVRDFLAEEIPKIPERLFCALMELIVGMIFGPFALLFLIYFKPRPYFMNCG